MDPLVWRQHSIGAVLWQRMHRSGVRQLDFNQAP